MSKRYTGMETCTSRAQIVRYLTENYVDGNAVPMPHQVARQIVTASAEQIRIGIGIFGSNVEYLGDEALKNSGITGWTYIPDEEEEDEDW